MVDLDSFYKDSCVIKRTKGTVDAQGNEEFDSVLSCPCSLQIGNTGGSVFKESVWRFGSLVIMPYTEVSLRVNDSITITSSSGRVVSSTVENYDSFDWSGLQGTVVWLKQGEDEQ